VGEFFFSAPLNNFNIWQDYGRSDDDQRHRLVFDGSVQLSHGFQLTGSLQYYSAPPFNVTTGANSIQGTAARPTLPDGSFIGRNTGTGFDFLTVSTRLSRTFGLSEHLRMHAIAEAFNTLNHRNDLIPNGTFGSGLYPVSPAPAFGRAAAVSDPRTLQLALRLTF
jgi:hypothetical protein